MADVFFSYGRQDKGLVEPIARALEELGYTVWWDRQIVGGAEFSKDIERELNAATVVVVAWSSAGVESTWVKDEASAGRDQGKLIPINLDDSIVPMGFRQFQSIDFSEPQTRELNVALEQLNHAIQTKVDASLGVSVDSERSLQGERPLAGQSINLGHGHSSQVQMRSPSLFRLGSLSRGHIIAAAAVLSVLIGIIWLLPTTSKTRPLAETNNLITDVSLPVPGYEGHAVVAVLPFRHESDDIENDYIADGITEDIITTLYTYRSIPVIARTSTFTYKNSSKTIPQIAEELGAGYIVEGSVRVIGEKARITAQLVNADGTQVWAESIDIPRNNLPKIADEITHRIAAAVEPEIMSAEVAKLRRSPPAKMEAWDYYLKARSLAAEHYAFKTINGDPLTVEMHEEARELLEKAIELEPNFAAAYSLLTHIDGVYVVLLHTQITPEERAAALERALSNAAKTQALSPFDATACSCQILLLLVKNEVYRATTLAAQALDANPGNAVLVSGAAKAFQVAGQNAHALDLIQRAKRLSPRDMSMATFLGFESLIHVSMGNFHEGADTAERGILLDPENLLSHLPRILSLYLMDDRIAAVEALSEFRHYFGSVDPEIAWPWPEPIPPAVYEALPEHMKSASNEETLATLISNVLKELDGIPIN